MAVTTSTYTSEATEFVLHERRFGIEFEYGEANPERLIPILEDIGLHVTERWRDGGWESGWDAEGELRSPPLSGSRGVDEVMMACDALKELGASPSHYGLHVHHDVEDVPSTAVVRLLKNYATSQMAIRELIAPRRWHFSYCEELNSELIAQLGENPDRGRLASYTHRVALSTYRIDTYETVEFRQHEATIDAEETLAWVAFGQAMIYAAKANVAVEVTKAEDLIAVLAESGKLCFRAARVLREKAVRLRPRERTFSY